MNYEKLRDLTDRTELRERLTDILTRTSCKGISAAVCGEASVLLKCAAGVRDGETSDPITTESVFWGDQLAAPILAYMAWKLHEIGAFDLYRPLSEYTAEPFLPGERNLSYVTGFSVLTQTSGFPRKKREDGMPTRLELMPSTLFSYSDYALLYLQRAMTQAVGADLQILAEDMIFKPFRMRSSSFVWKPEYADTFAHPHTKGAPNKRVRTDKPNASRYFYTTPTDYCLFLNKIFVPQTSSKCLTPITLEKMLTPSVELYCGLKWTAGFGHHATEKGTLLWQFGDNEGSKSLAFIDKEKDVCVCIMANDARGFHACRAFSKEFLGASPEAWDRYDGFSADKMRYEQKRKSARKKYN